MRSSKSPGGGVGELRRAIAAGLLGVSRVLTGTRAWVRSDPLWPLPPTIPPLGLATRPSTPRTPRALQQNGDPYPGHPGPRPEARPEGQRRMANPAPASTAGGIDIIEHRLANGLRVVLSEDHLTPVAAVCLWYDVGSRHEVAGRTGLAHLFEHLMFQGSASVKGNGHFELIQAAGGSLNGTTSFERTNYFETMPAHQLELALWLEADRMGSLLVALDETSLENQRDVVKNERRQRYDNVPYGTAFERLTAMAYPEGHPYHHTPIGSMADLDAASLADAQAFFRTYYAPNNAVLAVVGDIDPAQTLAWVEKYFGSIPG